MFWAFLRVISEYYEVYKVMENILKTAPYLENIIKLFSKAKYNPSQIVKKRIFELLRKITPQQLKELQKHINELNKSDVINDSFKKYVKEYTGQDQQVQLTNINNIKIPLKSSWLAYGIFTPQFKTPGDELINSAHGFLEWATRNGYGPYITPDISYKVWEAMVYSPNHAGKVGWDYGVFNRTRNKTFLNIRVNTEMKRFIKYGARKRK